MWLDAVIVTARWPTVTVPAVYESVYLFDEAPEHVVAGVVPAADETV